jgi:hypothetical protein
VTADEFRYQQLERFLNVAGKSGYVDVRVVLAEMAKLLGIPEAIL